MTLQTVIPASSGLDVLAHAIDPASLDCSVFVPFRVPGHLAI
jgi:hypothetical protein